MYRLDDEELFEGSVLLVKDLEVHKRKTITVRVPARSLKLSKFLTSLYEEEPLLMLPIPKSVQTSSLKLIREYMNIALGETPTEFATTTSIITTDLYSIAQPWETEFFESIYNKDAVDMAVDGMSIMDSLQILLDLVKDAERLIMNSLCELLIAGIATILVGQSKEEVVRWWAKDPETLLKSPRLTFDRAVRECMLPHNSRYMLSEFLRFRSHKMKHITQGSLEFAPLAGCHFAVQVGEYIHKIRSDKTSSFEIIRLPPGQQMLIRSIYGRIVINNHRNEEYVWRDGEWQPLFMSDHPIRRERNAFDNVNWEGDYPPYMPTHMLEESVIVYSNFFGGMKNHIYCRESGGSSKQARLIFNSYDVDDIIKVSECEVALIGDDRCTVVDIIDNTEKVFSLKMKYHHESHKLRQDAILFIGMDRESFVLDLETGRITNFPLNNARAVVLNNGPVLIHKFHEPHFLYLVH